MRDQFVKLGDAEVRFAKVVAVVAVPGRETSDVYFEGGDARVELLPDEVFAKLDAAEKRYRQERVILDFACRAETARAELSEIHASRDYDPLHGLLVAAERDLSRAVREYMGYATEPANAPKGDP